MCGGNSKFRWRSYSYGLARRLTTLRTMRGLTQERLAELSGVSRNQISNIERNTSNSGSHVNPRLETIYQLALALEVPVVALLPGSGELLTPILSAEDVVNVDVIWPTQPADIMAFDSRHRSGGSPSERYLSAGIAIVHRQEADKREERRSQTAGGSGNSQMRQTGGDVTSSTPDISEVTQTDPSKGVEDPEESKTWLMGVEWPWVPRQRTQKLSG